MGLIISVYIESITYFEMAIGNIIHSVKDFRVVKDSPTVVHLRGKTY